MPLHPLGDVSDAFAWSPPSPDARAWSRVVLATLTPTLDGGLWPLRRALGEPVVVTAGFVTDGHDRIAADLVVTAPDGTRTVTPMPLTVNDEYVATFVPDALGPWTFAVRGWLDTFGTWRDQFRRRVDGGETEALLRSEMLDAAALVRDRAALARGADKKTLTAFARRLDSGDADAALDADLERLMAAHDPRTGGVESAAHPVAVDPPLATFAAWYEFFPRSAADPGPDGRAVHGTLDDAARRLARIRELGFDVVYLPPIHPIGRQHRKGKDGALTAGDDEPGSPWAIGGFFADGTKGGHTDVADELGGLPAFERFMDEARQQGLAVALDIAFQASPDHPWVESHPEWFRHRADGSIRYAENPPKKYQDVYPFDFECEDWRGLWTALKGVFDVWLDRGVRVFRVDNPHTKPFAFWAWCLREIRKTHPDVVFLAEAFSRPRVMQSLAKLGFNNSYTYFTWRESAGEIAQYLHDLWHTEQAEYFRPNLWPNTPDIFTDSLAHGGRALHVSRFVLAATMSPTYGVYGPPYEHPEQIRKHPVKEEYADNEKYEVRAWNWHDPTSLQPLMRRVNEIRRAHPALQQGKNVRVVPTGHDALVAFVKWSGDDRVLVVASLDPHHDAHATLSLDLGALGLDPHRPVHAYEALGGVAYEWHGPTPYVRLGPDAPAQVFVLRQ